MMIPKLAIEADLPASSPAMYRSGITAKVTAFTAPKRIVRPDSLDRNYSDDGKEFLWAVTIVSCLRLA
jgi:hypothetical protein